MPTTLAFGPFRLDTGAEILYRGTEPVGVGQRAVALLRVLIERAGTPVTKEALIEAAWPGLAVEESNLTVQIAALRRVFAQEPGGERWIETLPRRGYRFIGPVEATDDDAKPTETQPAEAAPALPLPDKPSIAVLPFENLSGDPEQEYFADGLADEIITGLSKFHWFFVIARNSSFAFKGRPVDVKEVARELGVQYVLEGSVRRAGNRVRIIAQLIDALTGRHVWADRYDRDLEDIFAVQDGLTEAIVSAVAPSFISAESRRAERKAPESFEVWDYALRGSWHLSRHSKTELEEARRLFEKALELDRNSSLALSGLAITFGFLIGYGLMDDFDEARRLGYEAARRAIELDEEDAGAHMALGLISYFMHRVDAGIGACERALELNPNFATAEGWLSVLLSWRGDDNAALLHAERARRLSPRDSYSIGTLARCSAEFGAGRYQEAVEWGRRAVEVTPKSTMAWRYLAASLAHLGQIDEARAATERLLALMPDQNLRQIGRALISPNNDRLERFVDGLRKAGLPE